MSWLFLFLGISSETLSHVALWAGLLIISVTLLSTVIYRQHLDYLTWLGITLIALGITIIYLSLGHSY